MHRPHRLWFALLGLALALPAAAGEPAPPPDLALVPPDAAAFVHVRVADVWASDLLAEYRETVQKAGKDLLAAYDRRFLSLPSSIERVTAFGTVEGGRPGAMAVLVTVAKSLDRAAVVKQMLPDAVAADAGGQKTWTDERGRLEVSFPADRLIAVGPPGTARALQARRAADGPLTPALKLARTKAVVVAVNPQVLPAPALRAVPPGLQPLLTARLATLSADIGKAGTIALRLDYPDADRARAAEAAARKGLAMARAGIAQGRKEMEAKVRGDGRPGTFDDFAEATGAVFALGMMNRLDGYLDVVPLERDGDALQVALKLPAVGSAGVTTAAVAVALLVPAVQKVREAAVRTQSQNNLKQIALAMHAHHDVYKKLPAAALCDRQGKPLLSWRVAILPYIEQDALYREFKLDEPWDSPHNVKLLPRMPAVYALAAAPPKPGETYYRVFVGGGAGFELAKGLRFPDFTDGTSNTIMAVEAAESVPWTKPDELVYDPQRPLPRLGTFHGGGANVALFDGSVRFLRGGIAERTLRAAITRAGGEVLNLDD